MLLKGHAEQRWSAEAVAEELRRSSRSACSRLQDLERSKLVARDERQEYAYLSGPHDEVVEELEREFAVRRVRLIEAIYMPAVDSARSFADAFRLWEDENDR